jgi:uncharacterized YigZ family protein
MDVYFTLAREARHEIKVKGSRFIGNARVVSQRTEAESTIETICRQYHDASHHCFGYRVGLEDDSLFRYSDAGEPAGTAGKPIMDVIDGKELTSTLCVVTRYFGGTKLGTGGLSRAYGQCAAETLKKGGRKKHYITVPVSMVFAYDLTGKVMQAVSHFNCSIEETEYGSETQMHLNIRRSQEEAFKQELRDLSAGKIRFLIIGG